MTLLSPAAPALVAAHSSNGALATIRDLGRAGIPVHSPRAPLTSPVRFSNFVSTVIQPFPDGQGARRQIDWLLRAGRDHPGMVLLPALDDLTSTIAAHQDALRSYFHLYYPPGHVVDAVLNKESLHTAAAHAGIETPEAWFPASPAEARQLSRDLRYPVVLKPRTHVGTQSWFKGGLVPNQARFEAAYGRAAALLAAGAMEGDSRPADLLPFVQTYLAGAGSQIYNLAGFLDHTGLLGGFSATRKVFQTPRRFGIGVCFEAAPVEPELAARLTEMLRGMGFFGMFEAEFIEADGAFLLIDLNPRIFNGLSLVTRRGLRLPLIWYLAALGDWAAVEDSLPLPGGPARTALARAPGAIGSCSKRWSPPAWLPAAWRPPRPIAGGAGSEARRPNPGGQLGRQRPLARPAKRAPAHSPLPPRPARLHRLNSPRLSHVFRPTRRAAVPALAS